MDHDLLIRIDERTEQIMKDIQGMKSDFGGNIGDHEERIRNLERSKWAWGGAIGAISIFASWAVNALISAIKHV